MIEKRCYCLNLPYLSNRKGKGGGNFEGFMSSLKQDGIRGLQGVCKKLFSIK